MRIHLAKIRDTQEEISMSVQEQARKFMLANDASPVVAGEVIGNGGQGGRYTLKDGRTFTLPRSEEHTSELQSLMRISYAVFCLKKKNTIKNPTTRNYSEYI